MSSLMRRFISTHSPASDVYDVVIVGGGMVGLALAAALRSDNLTASLRLAIIDRQPPPAPVISLPNVPEIRVSTLIPASANLLKKVGAWHLISPPRSAAFHEMQVWDESGRGFVRYDSHSIGAGEMGWVAENSVITSALYDCIKDDAGVDFLVNTSIAAVDLPPYGRLGAGTLANIELENGDKLRTRLLIGADGAQSKVRSLSGLRLLTQKDYKQRGLVATVTTEPHNRTALQRFLHTGPLALLPVRDGYSNIVWSCPANKALELEEASPSDFADAVNEALTGGPNYPPKSFGGFSSSSAFIEPPKVTSLVGSAARSFPLVLRHAGKYTRPRLTLIGDAAHSVHPLAGQGVNLGFGDVVVLARAIRAAIETGTEIGDSQFLETFYERPRKNANSTMISALDGLQRLFTPSSGPVALLRNVGLNLVDASPVVKQTILRYAMFGS